MFQATGSEPVDKSDVARRAKTIFQRMDKNNDKSLTFEEFMHGCMSDQELFQLLTNSGQEAEEEEEVDLDDE